MRAFAVALIFGLFFSILNPAARADWPAREPADEASAGLTRITGFQDHRHVLFQTRDQKLKHGDTLAIRSRTSPTEFIGFVEVSGEVVDGKGSAMILHHSRRELVLPGDFLVALDLSMNQPLYQGRTGLLVRDGKAPTSARYRPLVVQGFSIGETAANLSRHEFLISLFGHISYGITDRVMIGTLAPGFLFESPNAQLKFRAFGDDSDTVALGLSAVKIPTSSATAVNLTVYWDSVTSEKMITHTLATFAVATIDKFEDTVAIKTAGTSSLQTGYELVMGDWNRLLFGPSYNFETKTIGGYLAYKAIWDHFHLSTSLSTVDVRELKLDPKTGYVLLLEAYWRF